MNGFGILPEDTTLPARIRKKTEERYMRMTVPTPWLYWQDFVRRNIIRISGTY